MSAKDNSDYELLTEHLGYPPVSLLDDIINTINVLADRALDSVERLLLSIPPQNLGFTGESGASGGADGNSGGLSPEDSAKREIESGTHQLETLLTASIDRNFDKLELYAMQNILTVQPPALRPHVHLSHYAGLDFSSEAAADGEEGLGGLTGLRRQLQASQQLNGALQREVARNDALLGSLRSVLGEKSDLASVKREDGQLQQGGSTFGFLRDRGGLESAGADAPLTTTTEFALSQLQALRALSTSLHTILPDLSTSSASAGDGDGDANGGTKKNKSWRRERAEYVEGASRKYLERSGGLELGAQGEVRDGEYQGSGRNLSRGEVEGLEKVVAILGGGGGSDSQGDETMAGSGGGNE